MTDFPTVEERERLEMLAEECAEVIQVVTKILRHGWLNYHPDNPIQTNNILLMREITDLRAILYAMEYRTDIHNEPIDEELIARWNKKVKWTKHQSKLPD